MAYHLFIYRGRDSKSRALYFESVFEQMCVDTEDVALNENPQYDLETHNVCKVNKNGEPGEQVYAFGHEEDFEKYVLNTEERFAFVRRDIVWKPFCARQSDNKFGIFCAGGSPHIASLKFETYEMGGGWDLASFAFIVDNKPQWCKDAHLLSIQDKEHITEMCRNFKQER